MKIQPATKMDYAIVVMVEFKNMAKKPFLNLLIKRYIVVFKIKRTFKIWSDYYNTKNILPWSIWLGESLRLYFSYFYFLLFLSETHSLTLSYSFLLIQACSVYNLFKAYENAIQDLALISFCAQYRCLKCINMCTKNAHCTQHSLKKSRSWVEKYKKWHL